MRSGSTALYAAEHIADDDCVALYLALNTLVSVLQAARSTEPRVTHSYCVM
jgi:hypothetical protein